jgi:hypothetical protein
MSGRHIARSQLGGQSSITGFTYQRDFIVLFSARMICKSENITKMICEYRNDIEILVSNKLTSWQIKSTTANSVRPKEVYDSIRLFNFLNNTDEYSRFVLVSNRNFTKLNMEPLAYYELDDFQDVKSKIERKFNGKLEESLLAKLKFVKGPEPDSIRSIISQELSCLSREKKDMKKSVLECLISFVDNIWIGLKDITQFQIQDIKQRKNQDIDFKTITGERIKHEVLSKHEDIDQEIGFQFESGVISGTKLSEKLIDFDEAELRYLIKTFKRDSQFRHNVLRKFDDLSKTTKLYQSISFMKFLKKISKSEDKNELLAFHYILHNLILISKTYDNQIYSTLVANYKPLLSHAFMEFHGKASYSQTRNMLNSLDLSNEEWCELRWKRIRNAIISGITIDEIEKIYDDIAFLRNHKCKSLPQYRTYLAKEDEYIEVRKRIESLLISS